MTREDGEHHGTVVWVNGPVVRARSRQGFRMLEVVKVGSEGLIGEVIAIDEDVATIQVYEDSSGLHPGAVVTCSGAPFSVELGPGLVSHVIDGIQRPLERLQELGGDFIQRGVSAHRLDRERQWEFVPRCTAGTVVSGGEILGVVQETPLVEHRILVPPGIAGTLTEIGAAGPYTVDATIAIVQGETGAVKLTLCQEWEVRRPRPAAERLAPAAPLVTGQRVIDTFFPIAKGGTAAIPGGFGTGKTMTQHAIWPNGATPT